MVFIFQKLPIKLVQLFIEIENIILPDGLCSFLTQKPICVEPDNKIGSNIQKPNITFLWSRIRFLGNYNETIKYIFGHYSDDRQMDFAEQIESVAYVICGENSRVTFKNFRDIWHTRGVSGDTNL